jgi:thiol-disulfide isomerase/thioredoxin
VRGLVALAALGLVGAACDRAPRAEVAHEAAAPATTAPPTAAPLPLRPGAGIRIVIATDEGDAPSLIRTERLKAKAEGRVLVVYAGADWCAPCKRFKGEIRAGRLDERLGSVTLLTFDADRDAERLASAGYAFQYIPFVALPGPDGRPTDTEEATGKGGDAWRVLLRKLDTWQRQAN